MYVENPRITFKRNLQKMLDKWVKRYDSSYAEFARVAGIREHHLRYYRRGERFPTPEQMVKLAKALQQPVEMFFRR